MTAVCRDMTTAALSSGVVTIGEGMAGNQQRMTR